MIADIRNTYLRRFVLVLFCILLPVLVVLAFLAELFKAMWRAFKETLRELYWFLKYDLPPAIRGTWA